MALETMKGMTELRGSDARICVMDELKEKHPEMFREDGSMKYEMFEKEIRPNYDIFVRHDVNSISFNIQDGPIKENGRNGCQLTDMVRVALRMLEQLNQNHPCRENSLSITKLQEALMWQEERTKDRERRGVEGTSLK